MRHEDLSELIDGLEELRDALGDAADGDAIPADTAMRGLAAVDYAISILERLTDD